MAARRPKRPSNRFVFSAELWEYPNGSWHFVSLPEQISDDIEAMFGQHAAGFGSLRVEVTIGTSTWQTSIFPDSKRATYVLPIKKPVRKAENLDVGSTAAVTLDVIA